MKNRLEAILKELKKQRDELQSRVDELGGIKEKEQMDVDRLERRSLTNYFYQVVGKLDERLTED